MTSESISASISASIFGPVIALALWTGVVLALTGFRRIGAIMAGKLRPGDFRTGDSADVPPAIVAANRNLMNLLEMPVLFYVVSLCLYVTAHVHEVTVWLAWCYVALRVVHSLIHVTRNRVLPRFVAYAASNLVLLALWLYFMKSLVTAAN